MVLVNKTVLNIVLKDTGENISRSFNDSIGIMLRSYTNAINKQQKRTGKLFREKTKAECINCPKGLAPSFITANGTTYFTEEITERKYPQVCFNYIHQNPFKAGITKNAEGWEFSSAKDYAGLRHGSLINKDAAKKYVDIKI
jgi:putative transposase